MFSSPNGALNGAEVTGRSPAALEAYLKSLRNDPVLARLAAIYAPLTISGGLGPADALDSVAHADRLALAGSPGSGKSTLLRLAARRTAGNENDPRPARIPAYVDLSKAREGEGVDELTARSVAEATGQPLDVAALDGALLLFDNLDRVTDVYLLEGLELLFRAGGRVGPSVVVACREADWGLFASWFADVPVATLQPLSPAAAREALVRSLPPQMAEEAARWLDRDRSLAGAASRPLALGALIQAISDRPTETWRRGAVLDALLEAFLRDIPAAERPAYRTALQDVALASLELGLPVEVDTVRMGLGVSRDRMIQTGVVTADGPRLAFVEPLLAHHCAAAALASRGGGNPRRLAERLGDISDGRLADTLVHVYSLAPSPADFIAALLVLPGGPEVAARCMSEPQAAGEGAPGPEAVVAELVALAEPVPTKSLFRLGEALARHGREPAAEIALRAALERTGDDVNLDDIFERSDTGDDARVSEWVRDYLRNRNRGLALKGLGDAAADGALASAAHALDRLDTDLTFERGLAAIEAGDWNRALVAFETALAAEPDTVRYLFHYGRALLQLGRTEEALSVLTRARQLAPGNASLEAALAEALWATDDVAAAREHIQEARELDPSQPAFDHLAGTLSAELGELETAATRLREAVAAQPGDPEWHDELGQVLAESGDAAAAACAFRRACELAPDHAGYRRHLGQALLDSGETGAACAELDTAASLAPTDAGIKADLARGLAAHGDAAAALVVLAQAVAADDGWPADHLLMARLARQTGDLRRAHEHARIAVRLAPASERARTELVRVESALGGPPDPTAPGGGNAPADTPAHRFPAERAQPGTPAEGTGTELAPPDTPANRVPVDSAQQAPHTFSGGATPAPTARDRAADPNGLESLAHETSLHPNDAQVHRTYAHALRAAGDPDRALGLMRRAARLDPQDAGLLAELGWLALELGRLNEARYAAGAALELDPENPETLALSGDVERAAGDLDAARRAYALAADLAPHHPGYARRLTELGLAGGAAAMAAHAAAGAVSAAAGSGSAEPTGAAGASPFFKDSSPTPAQTTAPAPIRNVTPTQRREQRSYMGPAASERAAGLRRQGRVAEALAVLEMARDEGADDVATLEELAACFDLAGRESEALAAWAAAAAAGAGVETCLAWSKRARELGAIDDAIAGARQAVAIDANSAEAYAALSAAYEAAGLTEAALTAVSRAAALDPARALHRERQAALATQLGRLDEAVAALEEGIADNPRAARLHFALGEAFAERGWAAEARSAFRKAAQLAPMDSHIQQALAVNLAPDDLGAAIAAQERAVSADPENIPARIALARLYVAGGDDESAIRTLDRVVEMDPGDPEVLLERANCLARLGDPEAEDAFRACMAADPRDAAAALGLAALYAASGHEVAALDAYERVTELDPANVDAWLELGQLRRAAGDAAGAVAALSRATETDPERDDAFEALGGAYADMGRYSEAAAAFQEAAKRRVNDPDLQVRLGHTRMDAQDATGAVAAYEVALATRPDHLEALIGMSEAALESGRTDAALSHARRATEIAPGDATTWAAYATAARVTGDVETATDALGMAAEVAPNDPETYRLLAEVAQDRGQTDMAIGALGRLLELSPEDREGAVVLGELLAASGYDVHLATPEPLPPVDAGAAEIALPALERAAAHDGPDHLAARAARSLAVLRGRLGDTSGALTAAARANALAEDPDTLRTLAWARLLANEPGPALQALGLARALGGDDASTHMLAAEAHLRRGDYSLAAEAFRLAYGRQPGLADACAGLGACQAALGRTPEALEAYRAAVGLEPGRWERELGQVALGCGELDEAADAFARYVAEHPGAPDARRDLARIHALRGDALRATEELHRALTLAPNHPEWYADLADLQRELGEVAAARESLAKALSLDGANPSYRLTQARLALAEGDAKGAREAVSAALEASPTSTEALALMGRIALADGDAAAARDAFAKAVNGSPEDASLQYWMGVTSKAAGQMDEALDHLESAARLSDGDPDTFLALGDIYRDMSAPDDAIQAYEQAASLNPDDARPHLRLAELCREVGMPNKALAHYSRAASLDPTDFGPWWSMARMLADEGQLADAAEAYKEAVARSPETPDVYFEAGVLFKRMRDYGRAADMFRRATKRSPSYAAAYTQLATVSALNFLDRSGGTADQIDVPPFGADEISLERTEVAH